MYNDLISKPEKSGATNLDRVNYGRLLIYNSQLEAQIEKLAGYLLKNDFHADLLLNYKAEGSAVDLAIRLLKLYTNRTE